MVPLEEVEDDLLVSLAGAEGDLSVPRVVGRLAGPVEMEEPEMELEDVASTIQA